MTSTSRCGNNFRGVAILHRHTDILQGIDIPAGKKIREKGGFWKVVQEDIFVALSQETTICIFSYRLVLYGENIILLCL